MPRHIVRCIHAVKQHIQITISPKLSVERKRQGEVLLGTIQRHYKGPLGHFLAKVTPEEKKMDKIVRSISEVDVAMRKIQMRNPGSGCVVGSTSREKGCRLRKLAEDVWKENERRRLSQSKVD